jgi:hypothetical protein
MATKAEAFKAQQQVDAHDRKPKRTAKRKRKHEGRRVSRFGDESMDRNANNKAGNRGGAALESSAGRPSRKSTRASSDGTKRTTNQQLRATMRQHAPSSRAKARRH